MKDILHNELKLVPKPNGHMLVLGQAGQGKTYFLCRQIEEYIEQKKKVYVIDYSGSFTEEELKEKNFQYMDKVKRINVAREKFCWYMRLKNENYYQKDVTDSLLEVFRCSSYFQRKLLENAISKIIADDAAITFPGIILKIEEQLFQENMEESIAGNKDNLGRLLTRLDPFEFIDSFSIDYKESDEELEESQVVVIDLTEFPEKQRRFMTELITSLLWKEIYRKDRKNRCDALILDEFQFLSVKDGSTIAMMLREGRKKGLHVVMSTQFISYYSKSEIQSLQQAANKILFRPTEDDLKFSAKLLDGVKWKEWMKILMNLQKGEAVVKGCFRLKGRYNYFFDSLCVKI